MAVTSYTPLLSFALPATGDLSGTWGETINNSITSLIDSAIAGTTTLTVDLDITLTTIQGAANTSREAVILWTAGGTATRTITVPAQSKIYTVINASSSTQSIIVRGATPTTGVTIIKGETAQIAWNGSDFVKIAGFGGTANFNTLTNAALTSGRVPYASTNGLMVDSAGFTYNSSTTTFTAPIVNSTNDAVVNGLTVGRGGGSVASNTALGLSALSTNFSGANNAAVGKEALKNSTGSGNIAINPYSSAGAYAPVFDPTTENNRACFGSTSITNAYVQVAWTVVSDIRDKTDFAPVPHGLEFVNKITPTAYRYKETRSSTEGHGPLRYGFKAQDVLALEGGNSVIVDAEDPEKLRFNDQAMIAVLVNAINELTARLKILEDYANG